MAKAVTLKNTSNEEVYPVTDISLVNGQIPGAKLYDATVGSDKLTLNAVWEENIKDGAVTAAKIADSTITPDKFDLDSMPLGQVNVWSSSQITATTDSQKGSVTITTTKPVRIMLLLFGVLKTSRYTSHIMVKVDGVEKANAGTNNTSFISVTAAGYAELSAGTHTISYWLGGQDSGTTAALASYCNNGVIWWVA